MDSSLIEALNKCTLFENIPEEKYSAILSCLSGERRHYSDGEVIRLAESEGRIGVILAGNVRLLMYGDGDKVICVNNLGSGEVFGNELISDPLSSPLQIESQGVSDVLYLDYNPLFITTSKCPYKAIVTTNLLKQMSQELLFLNEKVKLLAEPRLRERIRLYLSSLPTDGDKITLSLNRNELASLLCVDRSALSRELGRMKDDGILDFEGKVITIKNFEYF